MKSILAISAVVVILAVFVPSCTEAPVEVDPRTALLDDQLKPLYRDVISGLPKTEIVGQKLDLTLDLRYCSEQSLLFNDTRVVIDEDTKYYFVEWQLNPGVLEPILGKRDAQCRVEGTIVEVRGGEVTSGMPYVVATLDSISLLPSDASSNE
jgi:hypothetical protein